jgi:hypothetical protein
VVKASLLSARYGAALGTLANQAYPYQRSHPSRISKTSSVLLHQSSLQMRFGSTETNVWYRITLHIMSQRLYLKEYNLIIAGQFYKTIELLAI